MKYLYLFVMYLAFIITASAAITVTGFNDLVDNQKFDENGGTIASDSSGNGNTGTLYNFEFNANSGWTAGKIGSGIKYDGINDYVQVPDSNSLDATTLTFEAWIKYNGLDSQLTQNEKIVTKKVNWDDANGWSVELNRGGVITVLGSGRLYYRFNALPSWDNAWHHLAVTISGSQVSAYLDGNSKGIGTINSLIANNVPLSLGRMQGETFSYFNGTIDDVKIYKRILSASEINAEYLKGGKSAANVSTPVFSPSAGTYTSIQSISISTATTGAKIHYTLDGTTPNESSPIYSVPISISTNTTVKAGAWKSGSKSSTIASATYIIAKPVLTSITVSPSTASVAAGSTQTFTAATLDQNGKPITATVTWTSSNTAAGTIDSAGKFTALASGTTTITASSGSVKGTATATVTARATTIAFVTDARPSYATNNTILTNDFNQLIPQSPTGSVDAVVMAGDMEPVDSGTINTASAYSASTARNVPAFFAVGNHEVAYTGYDVMSSVRAKFSGYSFAPRAGPAGTSTTTYSFNAGDIHVVVLNEYWDGGSDATCAWYAGYINAGDACLKYSGGTNGNGGFIPEALFNWLQNDLNANTKHWTVVVGHEPLYPQGNNHVGDSLDQNTTNRNRLQNLFISKNVTAFVGGHTHQASLTTIGNVFHADAGVFGVMAGRGAPNDNFATIMYTSVNTSGYFTITKVSENPTWSSPARVVLTKVP